MQIREDCGIFLDPIQYPNVDDPDVALDAVGAHLQAQGQRRRVVDRALLDARAEMVWWSDRLGLTHDCSKHTLREATTETCDPLARLVPMVLGLPSRLLRQASATGTSKPTKAGGNG